MLRQPLQRCKEGCSTCNSTLKRRHRLPRLEQGSIILPPLSGARAGGSPAGPGCSPRRFASWHLWSLSSSRAQGVCARGETVWRATAPAPWVLRQSQSLFSEQRFPLEMQSSSPTTTNRYSTSSRGSLRSAKNINRVGSGLPGPPTQGHAQRQPPPKVYTRDQLKQVLKTQEMASRSNAPTPVAWPRLPPPTPSSQGSPCDQLTEEDRS